MEHLTWLDWFAEHAEAMFLEQARKVGRRPLKIEGETLTNLVKNMTEQGWPGDLASIEDRSRYVFWNALIPFVMSAQGRGLKISPRLVHAFAHTRAPATDEWQPVARERGWYFDLPHGAMRWGSYQARAILTSPDLGTQGVAVAAVLTKPNSNEIVQRSAWMLLGHSRTIPAPDENQDAINHFLRLTFLYFKTQSVQTLPQRIIPLSGTALERRHQRRQRSLFIIHPLEASASIARPSEHRGAWTIEHRIDVKGHFRWQPCGKNWGDRHLIWIDEHVRGAELTPKPVLNPLRKKN